MVTYPRHIRLADTRTECGAGASNRFNGQRDLTAKGKLSRRWLRSRPFAESATVTQHSDAGVPARLMGNSPFSPVA